MRLHGKWERGGMMPLKHSDLMSIDLTLDLLGGCQHSCPGCFVNKKLPYLEDDLDSIVSLVEVMHENEYSPNELFLGPTDIFSALNFDEIITNEKFVTISKSGFTFKCTTTCLNDMDEMKRRYELIRSQCSHWDGRDFEVFVVLDCEKYLSGDIQYLEQFNHNLELLQDHNVFLLVNVYSEEMFSEISLYDLNQRIKQDYDCRIRINPSYFRGTSKRHVERYAQLHKQMLEREINDKTIEGIFLNMIDVYFGGYTFINFSYTDHELYIAPLLYEAIPTLHQILKVPKAESGKYTIEAIEHTEKDLFLRQYEYSAKTAECSNCEYLASCVSRDVLAYMETLEIKDCFMPKKLFRDTSQMEIENVA